MKVEVVEVGRPVMRNTGWLGVVAFPARALCSNLHRKVQEIRPDPKDSLSFQPATTGADGGEYQTETGRFSGLDRMDYEVIHPTWKPSCSGRLDEMGRTVIHTDTSWDTFRTATNRHLVVVRAEVVVLEFPSSV